MPRGRPQKTVTHGRIVNRSTYKWTDDNGTRHVSHRDPASRAGYANILLGLFQTILIFVFGLAALAIWAILLVVVPFAAGVDGVVYLGSHKETMLNSRRKVLDTAHGWSKLCIDLAREFGAR